MMPAFLAILGLVVVIMIIVSAVIGWGDPVTERMVLHMYWGVATSLMGLFAHTLTLFFFIGTGKAIREACQDHEQAWPFIGESSRFKGIISGRSMLANLVFIVQPILGAALYSGSLHSHWHLLGFGATLAVHGWAYGTELKYLGLNNVLMSKVAEWRITEGIITADPADHDESGEPS